MVVGIQIHSVHVTLSEWVAVCVCVCTCMCVLCESVHVCMHAYVCVCVCVYMCMHAYMCVCVRVCVSMRVHVFDHSHTCGASVFVYLRQIYRLGLYFNVTPEARYLDRFCTLLAFLLLC